MRLLFYPARTSTANPLWTARFALHGWNAQPVRAKRTIFGSYIFFLLGCAASPLPPPLFAAHPLFVPLAIFCLSKRLSQGVLKQSLAVNGCVSDTDGIESAVSGVNAEYAEIFYQIFFCCKAAFTAAAKLTFHVKNRFSRGRQSQRPNTSRPFSPRNWRRTLYATDHGATLGVRVFAVSAI